MKVPCDICKLKCIDEVRANCINKDWVDFEPENEHFCFRCNAYKAYTCRLADDIHCLLFIPILFTLAVLNDGDEEMNEKIIKMKGDITQ